MILNIMSERCDSVTNPGTNIESRDIINNTRNLESSLMSFFKGQRNEIDYNALIIIGPN